MEAEVVVTAEVVEDHPEVAEAEEVKSIGFIKILTIISVKSYHTL
jgi:hypothetical protein